MKRDSANHNECAEDSDRGGLFSSSLLDYANSIKSHKMACIYDIQMIYNKVASVVTTNAKGAQHPQIYSIGSHCGDEIILPYISESLGVCGGILTESLKIFSATDVVKEF